jgi:predicted secreted hydrolase
VYALRKKDGTIEPASSGTLRLADGSRFHLRRDDFEIEALDRWTSPTSGGEYPARWRLRVPAHRIDLEVRPVLAQQELRTRGTTGVNYWEGLCTFRGVRGPSVIAGRGYVELVGYAGEFVAGI